jgi:phage gp37-like protein
VHEIKRRTRAVLEKRLVRYQKALENRELIQAQTETIQEVLHLLRDQSYAMRDPRSIAEQLDGLVVSAEETERGVKDMEEILTLEQEPVLAGSLTAEIEAERQHYRRLQSVAEEIRQNYRGMTETSQMLLEQLVDKLDFLLAFYLRMRYSLTRYQAYFNTTNPEHIQERIAMLDHELEKGPKKVHEIKRRTRAVLEKRLLRYQKALENRELIQAQTETIQEVLHLLRDQSYAMRDPRSIAEQLDGLVISAEETERGVKDMEEILTLEQEPVLAGSLTAEIEAELEAGRAAMSEAPPVAAPTPTQASRPRPTTQNAPPPPPRRSKLTQRH